VLPDIRGVDVNMGCPKKFSIHGGMGSALMREPDNAIKIMKALVDNFKGKITVSCKVRVFNNFEESLKYVLAMQETGIDWISIHPRTAAEESRVPAKWYLIKRFIDTGLIKIPIYGSGDLFTPHDI
jgi:tRNA-dihydrouridine synthase